jgi:hypothetical protein
LELLELQAPSTTVPAAMATAITGRALLLGGRVI